MTQMWVWVLSELCTTSSLLKAYTCLHWCSAGFKAPDKTVWSIWLVVPCQVEENEYLNDLLFPIVHV